MIDRMKEIVAREPQTKRTTVLREFLQCMALRAMHLGHDFGRLAFIGGTALRFIYDLPRFSEGIDLSLTDGESFDLSNLENELQRHFTSSGIEVVFSSRTVRTVKGLWLKFPGILHAVGASNDPRRVLSIKLEVDTNPPAGAIVERRLINRHFPFAVAHYDLPSLFAGKLHAVLTRPYVKGRDYFDLVWYRTRHSALLPNFALLSAALEQTGWQGEMPSEKTWLSVVMNRIRAIDWDAVVKDVTPFLEDANDIKAMKLEYVLPLFGEK